MSYSHSNSDPDPDPDPNSNRPSPGTRLYNPYQDLHLPSQTLYIFPPRQNSSLPKNLSANAAPGAKTLPSTLAPPTSLLPLLVAAPGSSPPSDPSSPPTPSSSRSIGCSTLPAIQVGSGVTVRIVGLIYAMMESGIEAITDRGDVWSSVAAGLGTGAVCREARGVRSVAVAGALGGLAAGAVVAEKQALKRYAMI